MTGRLIEWLVLRVLARLFPTRFRLIPREGDGKPLLRQFKIFSFGKEQPRGTPGRCYLGCYLQSFANPERGERFHIHRWRYMLSLVLSGAFTEERPTRHFHHRAPSIYTMGDEVIHRLAHVEPRTWTLFFMLGRNRTERVGGWGYYDRDTLEYTPWNAAIPNERRVGSL